MLLLALLLWGVPLTAQQAVPPGQVVWSEQPLQWLRQQYQTAGDREFAGCLLGVTQGSTVYIHRIVPAVVISADTNYIEIQRCSERYDIALGEIHSHPPRELAAGDLCSHYHYVNGLQRWTKDFAVFRYSPNQYVVNAIYCGNRISWMDRSYIEQTTELGTL
jgi:hypothetical protein